MVAPRENKFGTNFGVHILWALPPLAQHMGYTISWDSRSEAVGKIVGALTSWGKSLGPTLRGLKGLWGPRRRGATVLGEDCVVQGLADQDFVGYKFRGRRSGDNRSGTNTLCAKTLGAENLWAKELGCNASRDKRLGAKTSWA